MSSTEIDTRTKILAAAWELLETQHGKNVRMSDVAKLADVSRQAVYLHFKSRSELMIATVQYGDIVLNHADYIQAWQEATGGLAKLDAWVSSFGSYIPQVYGAAKALMIWRDSDEAAEAAWQDRMSEVRNACRMSVDALVEDGLLSAEFTPETATDLFWTMLSFQTWESLTQQCGWTTEQYIRHMQVMVRRALVDG